MTNDWIESINKGKLQIMNFIAKNGHAQCKINVTVLRFPNKFYIKSHLATSVIVINLILFTRTYWFSRGNTNRRPIQLQALEMDSLRNVETTRNNRVVLLVNQDRLGWQCFNYATCWPHMQTSCLPNETIQSIQSSSTYLNWFMLFFVGAHLSFTAEYLHTIVKFLDII